MKCQFMNEQDYKILLLIYAKMLTYSFKKIMNTDLGKY